MDHQLDNPVWNALITGNKNLAEGNDQVKYFPAAIAGFVGLKEISRSGFESLFDIIPPGRIIAIVSTRLIEIPDQWKTIAHMRVLQMVSQNPVLPPPDFTKVTPLTTDHVPQMLALTKQTNPGPFFQRTIELGNYYGIFNGEQLVAMAGQRMHPGQYLEISAVCTHPDHHGNGYATTLMHHMAGIIRFQSCIPFLHVLTDNAKAIKLYNSLGFLTRREMIVHVIRKKRD
jgi:GNAT superfamily N-acetyltransferase